MNSSEKPSSNHANTGLKCSVIIPTKDQLNFLRPCVLSVLASDFSGVLEVLIVDNNSEDLETKEFLENITDDDRVKVIPWPHPFNYAEINNEAAKIASGEVLCFLNNDIEVISTNWLEILAPLAARHDVGAVGALLLYADKTIQHAGIALDKGCVARHIAHGEPENFIAENTPDVLCSVEAITAACMLTRRDLFLLLGGFNHRDLAISFNDVDYCLRLRAAGYPVLLEPRVKLTHYESISRKSDDLPENRPRALQEKSYMDSRWRRWLNHRHYLKGIPDSMRFLQGQTTNHPDDELTELLRQESLSARTEVLPGSVHLLTSRNEDREGFDKEAHWHQSYRELEIEYRVLEAQCRELQASLNDIIASSCWRLTAPLRNAVSFLIEIKQWCGRFLRKYSLGRKIIALKNRPLDKTVEHEADPRDIKAQYDMKARALFDNFLASGKPIVFPRAEAPLVSIVLVFFNKAPLSYSCLQSIIKYTDVPYEVIVVDNASADDTSLLISRLENVSARTNTENLGFVGAVNQGVAIARGKYILLLNNDAEIEEQSVGQSVKAFESNDEIGAVGGKIKLLDGSLQEAGSIIWNDGSCLGYGRNQDPEQPEFMFQREVDYCSGAFLLFERATFNALGGFDEAYAPAYYEESDFCIRLQKAGKKIIYEPLAQIRHYEFASSGGFGGANLLQVAHRKILCEKHKEFLAGKFPSDPANILLARTSNKHPNVLVIDDRVPHPAMGAGYPRCADILQELARLPLNITFYPLLFADDEWSETYETMPRNVEVMLHYGREKLKEFLQSRVGFYKYMMISRVHNMEFFNSVTDSSPGLISGSNIIYDAEAVTAPREILRLQLGGQVLGQKVSDKMILDEINLAEKATKIITVSQSEAEIYRRAGYLNTLVLGHKAFLSATPAAFADREGLLFVGAMRDDNSPNVDSIVWFVNEVLPKLVQALNKPVFLIIAGDKTAPQLHAINRDYVKFVGRMDDLSGLYNHCRLFIAPTRFAAGLPHKIHEAATYGIPCVTTSLLAQQLGWKHGEELLAADTAEDFARQCQRLYQDEELWNQLRNGGLKAVERDCSPMVFTNQVARIFSE